MVQPLPKIFWQFLKKPIMQLPDDPVTILLSICPKEMKMYVHTKTYNVNRSFICNNRKLKTQTSFNR